MLLKVGSTYHNLDHYIKIDASDDAVILTRADQNAGLTLRGKDAREFKKALEALVTPPKLVIHPTSDEKAVDVVPRDINKDELVEYVYTSPSKETAWNEPIQNPEPVTQEAVAAEVGKRSKKSTK